MKIDGMNDAMINTIFETVPGEITVIDAHDKVVGWNKHNARLFNRPEACYGMDFRECHPQKSLDLVEQIVRDFKNGTRKSARFWIDLPVDRESRTPHKILIEFFALRDADNRYLGCMEYTVDVEDIMHLTGEKRLMDEE